MTQPKNGRGHALGRKWRGKGGQGVKEKKKQGSSIKLSQSSWWDGTGELFSYHSEKRGKKSGRKSEHYWKKKEGPEVFRHQARREGSILGGHRRDGGEVVKGEKSAG